MSEVMDRLLAVAAPTLEELAREAGVSYAALRSWRDPNGRTPRLDSLDRLLSHLEERQSEVARLAKQARLARQRNPERRAPRKAKP